MIEIWTIDETLLKLFGRDLNQLEILRSKPPDWSLDAKWVRIKKSSEELERWCERNRQYFKKGQTDPIDKKYLEIFIAKGWGDEVECPYDIKREHKDHREAKDQFALFKKLERAVLDRKIETVGNHDIDRLCLSKWRLKVNSVLRWVESNLPKDNKKFYNKLKLALKKNKVKFHNKQKNKGGRPPVDPHGEIAAKIKELKLENISDGNIPWEIRFTKFVQQMKKRLVNPEYRYKKIPTRVKGKEYTNTVGISLDTVTKLIKQSPD